jgi:hypothetical protein
MAAGWKLVFSWCALCLGGEVEPPLVGRPAHFSGAVGSYRVTMRAEPTELEAEDPLTLTVRLTGSGPLEQLARPDLRKQAKFARQFEIENLKDRYLPDERAREFDYRLRPRSPAVREIPALPFTYFKPGFMPAHKGYQTTFASSIPLIVRPRAEVQPGDVQGVAEPLTAPDAVYELTPGPGVLRREEPFALPGPLALALLLAGPPLLCTAWYALWRQRYPDAARRVQQRRSRAARQALQALRLRDRRGRADRAQGAALVVTTYLRQRLDLPAAEPTPAEVGAHLQRMGVSPAHAKEVTEFFRASDAARFAPGPGKEADDWGPAAGRLILTLETELWQSRTL